MPRKTEGGVFLFPFAVLKKHIEYVSLVTEMSSVGEENPCVTCYSKMLYSGICPLECKDQDR